MSYEKQIKKLQLEVKIYKKKEKILIKKAIQLRKEQIYLRETRRKKQYKISKLKKEKYKPEIEKQIELAEGIIRKQVALNFVDKDNPDTDKIYISIRAITINPIIEERGLLIAIAEAKEFLENQYDINLRNYESSYIGVESAPISPTDAIGLTDERVHIEIFMGGKVVETYSI